MWAHDHKIKLPQQSTLIARGIWTPGPPGIWTPGLKGSDKKSVCGVDCTCVSSVPASLKSRFCPCGCCILAFFSSPPPGCRQSIVSRSSVDRQSIVNRLSIVCQWRNPLESFRNPSGSFRNPSESSRNPFFKILEKSIRIPQNIDVFLITWDCRLQITVPEKSSPQAVNQP